MCSASSNGAVTFFKEHADEFLPVHKFTSFFDNENFLLTPYTISNRAVHTIIENFQGDLLEFSGLLCGYGGQGPHATAEVLQMLGVEKTSAERLIWNNGIQIEFHSSGLGSPYSVNTETIFNGRVRHREFIGLNLDKFSICNPITRNVYLINPEINNFNGLLNCLHVMKPVEFEYLIGERKGLLKFSNIPELTEKTVPSAYPTGTDGVNLIIRGQNFDVHCFIDSLFLRGTLNAVYLYLKKEPLFYETQVRSKTYISEIKPSSLGELGYLLKLFKPFKAPIHKIIPVTDEELKKDAG